MTVTVQQAQNCLAELIAKSAAGETVVITGAGNDPIAQIVPVSNGRSPQFGFAKGRLTILKDDDEHLTDFREYMPK